MQIIVVSGPDLIATEAAAVVKFFKAGLTHFHLRKPRFNKEQLKEYIDLIPKKFHNRIVLHTHHKLALKYKLKGIHLTKSHRKKKMIEVRVFMMRLKQPGLTVSRSFHRLSDLKFNKKKYSYVIFSPTFKSASSKKKAPYPPKTIEKALRFANCDVFAMGGIDDTTIPLLNDIGFSGAVLHNSIWSTSEDALSLYKAYTALLKQATSTNVLL